MKLLETFDKDGAPNRYRFVFDEVNAVGHYAVLAMTEDGRRGVWVSEHYDPAGDNGHLGSHVALRDLSDTALSAFFGWLSIPRGQEDFYAALDELATEYEPEEPSVEDRMDVLLREMRAKGEW